MSVDMPQDFALNLWSWPEVLGLVGFIVYPIIAFRLLFKKGVNGLLGFALLCPWLLFATELSTVRIQESFVLYRSYLWMAGAFAALPFLCQKLSAKQTVITLSFMVLFMMAVAWLRLTTFSHPLLLWSDAARLVEHKAKQPLGVDRIYYNRGSEFLRAKHYKEAIADFNLAINSKGYYTGYAYHNRGVVYFENGQYLLALNDFNKAIESVRNNPKPYVSKAKALEALNDKTGARLAYQKACEAGATVACDKK
jgi:tetratricopeptide (TPR) repeat protein